MALKTPFGDVVILIDDIATTFSITKSKKKEIYKDVFDSYRIIIDFVPDGKNHEIKCIFPNIKYTEKSPESGENIECQSFYNDKGDKLSICLQGDVDFLSEIYDYKVCYLENGMSYKILENTQKSKYIFGIAWINNVFDEFNQIDNERDIQTWFASDFTLDLNYE